MPEALTDSFAVFQMRAIETAAHRLPGIPGQLQMPPGAGESLMLSFPGW